MYVKIAPVGAGKAFIGIFLKTTLIRGVNSIAGEEAISDYLRKYGFIEVEKRFFKTLFIKIQYFYYLNDNFMYKR